MKLYIGIDPGIHGAVAFYAPDLDSLHVEALPIRWKLVNRKKRFELDVDALTRLLLPQRWSGGRVVLCEEPHAMPGAGATSLFSFGNACGTIKGVIGAVHVHSPFERISYIDPSTWKRVMGCTSDKNRTRALASQVFPGHKDYFMRQSDDGKAEAALLAHYAAHRPAPAEREGGAITRKGKR